MVLPSSAHAVSASVRKSAAILRGMRLASVMHRSALRPIALITDTEASVMKTTLIAAGLMIALSAPVMADTPIGAGVTGAGGTGATTTDSAAARTQAGTETKGLRPDGGLPAAGSANTSGSANAAGTVSTDKNRGATGSAGAGAGGNVSGTPDVARQISPER
jgi:hypothetical protein